MKLFKSLILLAIMTSLLLLGLDVARTLWLEKEEEPSVNYTRLTQLPARTIESPKVNGYLVLLGFAVSSSLDPVQIGKDMWVESESAAGHRFFDYGQRARTELRVEDDLLSELQPGQASQAATPAHLSTTFLPGLLRQHAVLLDRYRFWLSLPFQDWGYGLPGTPRFVEIVAAHRLYLTEGFAQGIEAGVDRTVKDLSAWRQVLAEAKTLQLKLLALTVVEEDLALLNQALRRRDFDQDRLPHLALVLRPLTQSERSLRWPIQHEFLLGVRRADHPHVDDVDGKREESEVNRRWVAALSGVSEAAIRSAERFLPAGALVRSKLQKQRALNICAEYVEATIQATDTTVGPFPRLQDYARASHRKLVDYLLNPVDNVFASSPEPDWGVFVTRIQETDARLRLAGLHLRLHRAPTEGSVSARIAQAGLSYYDPFTGLPMLWNQETGRIYSAGRDKRDDGGDDERDLTLTITLQTTTAASAQPAPPAKKRPARRS
ncbi:MAG: hypothetical protein AB1411_15530 [Nitrospirota bacterium]